MLQEILSLDGPTIWFLGAVLAVVLEIFIPSFAFLSLGVALLLVSVTQYLFSPSLSLAIGFTVSFWICATVAMRFVFGNWGSKTAVDDPNQYDRSSVKEPEEK